MIKLYALSLLLAFTACATPPTTSGPDPSVTAFINRQLAHSAGQEAAGDINGAMATLRSIETVSPSEETTNAINRLEALRREQIEKLVVRAQNAANPQAARLVYLNILLLDGNHKMARSALARLETEFALAQQARKDASRQAKAKALESRKETAQTSIARPAAAEQPQSELLQAINDALGRPDLAAAWALYASATPAPTLGAPAVAKLRDAAFSEGRAQLHADIEVASLWLRRALTIDPRYAAARSTLASVEKIQANLAKIRGRSE